MFCKNLRFFVRACVHFGATERCLHHVHMCVCVCVYVCARQFQHHESVPTRTYTQCTLKCGRHLFSGAEMQYTYAHTHTHTYIHTRTRRQTRMHGEMKTRGRHLRVTQKCSKSKSHDRLFCEHQAHGLPWKRGSVIQCLSQEMA